jgi:3'(2'), 5'-bisphosphate nucleotidase
MMESLPRLNDEACALAQLAGKRIMPFYKNGATITWKADASPLSSADSASHDFLMESLGSLTPHIPVISEESIDAINGSLHAGRSFWLVDPLDGTKEFLKGTNEFTVNIALIEEGRPILGIVHAPALNVIYYGVRNSGSWRKNGNRAPVSISARRADPWRLSVVASKDHAGPLVGAMLNRLTSPQLQSMGSALKFCLVAEGKADIYLRDLPTMEWDTAAAQCIVEAAGGGVYSLDGERLRYGKPGLKNGAIVTVGDTRFDWRSVIGQV